MDKMTMLSVAIFSLTYVGVALGRIPGLLLDRTGIAVLGAIGMVVSGVVSMDAAVAAVDFSTILLLYALMVVSAQLRLGGFYAWTALRITTLLVRPKRFLFTVMLTGAVLSALLANDIVCLAFTPVLSVVLLKARLNPMPFLLGLAAASNIGSAATIIGNPQNMLIGQTGRLHFGEFAAWCGPPAGVSLALSFGFLCWLYRGRFYEAYAAEPDAAAPHWPVFNPWQSVKGLTATLVLIFLFFTSVPRELTAIGIAGILLCSRKMRSRQMLELIDWHLISLFCALFVVIQGLAVMGIPARMMEGLARLGVSPTSPPVLTGVSTIMSNVVSNVPAVMLLIRFLDPGNPVEWYILAVSSTFAGNLITIGSIANLIVMEQAGSYGIDISFKEHARVGVPITILSLWVLLGWIAL